MKQKYIVVPNFHKYQHYTDRRLVWIKLYTDIVNDFKFGELNGFQKWIFLGILVLESWNQNHLPFNKNYLKKYLLSQDDSEKDLMLAINKLSELKLIAIKSLSSCYQNACLDKRREDKIRREYINKKKQLVDKLSYKG